MCTHTPSRKVARHKSTTTLVQKNKTESEPQKKESQNNVPNIDILDNLEKAAPIMLFAYQEAEQAREADELQTLQEVQAMYDALQPRNIGYAKTK